MIIFTAVSYVDKIGIFDRINFFYGQLRFEDPHLKIDGFRVAHWTQLNGATLVDQNIFEYWMVVLYKGAAGALTGRVRGVNEQWG